MGVYLSKTFSSPEEFEAWIKAQEHSNKDFLDNLCEQDKEKWDKKACKMTVKDGKLQLLCEDGNVLAETNYYQPDGDTVCCDGKDGKLSIKGIQNANDPNGKKFRVWVGTQAEYDAIRVKDPKTMYYITDETLLDDILSGAIKVGHAKKADNATKADSATNAEKAKKGEARVVQSIEGFENVAGSLRDGECVFVEVSWDNGINIRGVTVPNGACGTIFNPHGSAPILNLVDKNGNIYIGCIDDENWTISTGAEKAQNAENADSLNDITVTSTEQLTELLSTRGTYSVNFGDKAVYLKNKNGDTVVKIPPWSRGTLYAVGDVALALVDSYGRHFTAYHSWTGGNWVYKYDEVSHASQANIVAVKNVKTGTNTVDISDMGTGVYVVNIKQDGYYSTSITVFICDTNTEMEIVFPFVKTTNYEIESNCSLHYKNGKLSSSGRSLTAIRIASLS